MLFFLALISLAFASTETCCGTKDLVGTEQYTDGTCTGADQVGEPLDCPAEYPDNNGSCDGPSNDETACTTAGGTYAAGLTCTEKQATVTGTVTCDTTGTAGGLTLADDMMLNGCCGDLDVKTMGSCMCAADKLDKYKQVGACDDGVSTTKADCDTAEGDWEEMDCAMDEFIVAADATECNEYALKTASSCCLAADGTMTANTDLTKLKDTEFAMKFIMYTEAAACTTEFMTLIEVVSTTDCVLSEDKTDQWEKYVADDACTKVTTTYYGEKECTTALTDPAPVEEKPKACAADADMMNKMIVTELVCEAETPADDGSSVSLLSAFVVLVAAALKL